MAARYTLERGATVGKYEVVRQIGKGGFGDIWLCHKRDHEKKKVVIKALRVNPASHDQNKQALVREAEILKQLSNPTIVKFVDVLLSEDDRWLYIVMQYCEGGDLFHKLRKIRKEGLMLQEIQVVTWTLQIAMALRTIHATGIIHRDVKTQNIFLNRNNDAKLGDFGIARLLDTAGMASTVLGTPYYLSPELHRRRPYNHKSDMWAFGCCVAEMCTLGTAFDGANLLCIGNKVLNGKPPKLPRRLSPQLVQLVYSLLEKEPEKRPEAGGVVNHPAIQNRLPGIIKLAQGVDIKTERDGQGGQRRDSESQPYYTANDFSNTPKDDGDSQELEAALPPARPPAGRRRRSSSQLDEDPAGPGVEEEARATLTQSLVHAQTLVHAGDSAEEIGMPDHATYLGTVCAESKAEDNPPSTVHPTLQATTEMRGPDHASSVMMESIKLEMEDTCAAAVGKEAVDLALSLLGDIQKNMDALRDILGDQLHELLPSLQRIFLLGENVGPPN